MSAAPRRNPRWLVVTFVVLFSLCCAVGAVSYLTSVLDGAP